MCLTSTECLLIFTAMYVFTHGRNYCDVTCCSCNQSVSVATSTSKCHFYCCSTATQLEMRALVPRAELRHSTLNFAGCFVCVLAANAMESQLDTFRSLLRCLHSRQESMVIVCVGDHD